MKFNEKWTLFLVATFVTFFGIISTLLKGTIAGSDIPSNESFDDINFYKCVIDSYNEENATEHDYTYSLNDEELTLITKLNCSGEDKEENQIITSVEGLEKLTSLRELNIEKNNISTIDLSNNKELFSLVVSGNQLTSLNLSNNVLLNNLVVEDNLLEEIDLSSNEKLSLLAISNNKLTTLDLSNNVLLKTLFIGEEMLTELDLSNNTSLFYVSVTNDVFNKTMVMYKGGSVNIESPIKLPAASNLEEFLWKSNTTDVVTVSDNGEVNAINVGVADIGGYLGESRLFNNHIYVIEMLSDEYVVDNTGYIYVGFDWGQDITNNIDFSTEDIEIDIDFEEDNDTLSIAYLGEKIKDFKILGITLNDYNVLNKTINIDGEVNYSEFVSNIVKSESLSYKIFNNNEEVQEDDIISHGMVLRIYYNDNKIDEYVICDENNNVDVYEKLVFDDKLIVSNDNLIISGIDVGTVVSDILSMIDTNGEIILLDKYGNVIEYENRRLTTGDQVKIVFSSKTYIYKLSVTGEVTGDSVVDKDDVMEIAKHFINGNAISGEEYLVAADIDGNGTLGLNDIIKLVKYVLNNTEL